MPRQYPCVNHVYCEGWTFHENGLCEKCGGQPRKPKPTEKQRFVWLWNKHKGEEHNKHQRTEAEE